MFIEIYTSRYSDIIHVSRYISLKYKSANYIYVIKLF